MSSMAPGRPSLSGSRPAGTSGTATLLDRRNITAVRRSTPDSEALVSSDDDHDQAPNMSMSAHSVRSLPPVRRSSFLVDVRASQRRTSLGGVSAHSLGGTGSQPSTPSGDPAGANPWNSGIWSSQNRAGPSRVNEVLASPTTLVNPADDLRSPGPRDHSANANLPFDIPLEPNFKTMRSQSYSAGQLDRDSMGPYGGIMKSRTSLATRTSRPSMLGDGRDGLASLREDEDDLESSNGSDQGVRLGLASRNDLGSTTQTSAPRGQQRPPGSTRSGDSEYAVEEFDENGDSISDRGRMIARNVPGSASSSSTTIPAIVNQRLEGVKRSQPGWQSQLGFGVPEEGSQSRRHSFAVVERARNGSLGQAADLLMGTQYHGFGPGPLASASHLNGRDGLTREAGSDDRKYDPSLAESRTRKELQLLRINMREEQALSQRFNSDRLFAASYFAGAETHRRHIQQATDDFVNPFQVPSVYSRPGRVLYIVSFKCKRADIYYIPDNTGLTVKAGDTVIVEGDRGQDLGTVEHVNVTMDQAKRYKEEYTNQHFKCLMMFSRFYPHVAALANDEDRFNEAMGKHAAGATNSPLGMASYEPEPRPKMIKRVAKPDEVHLLREKEGNEAKAKRVCQNKVTEHNLRMEILDAEFQHDYRKLTFFYYAEEYINFNELVTDLFKVYKTRIWMSAINPASYTIMNPNNIVRSTNTPRTGQSSYAEFLRQQDTFSHSAEQNAPSPPDYLAARMGEMNLNAASPHLRAVGSSEGLAATNVSGTQPVNSSFADAFHAQLQPRFDPRAAPDPSSQYSPFAPPFGAGPWAPPAGFAPGMTLSYPPRDPASNYSNLPVSPALSNHPAFTPRSGLLPLHYAGSAASPFGNGDATGLEAQYQRYPVDPRRS